MEKKRKNGFAKFLMGKGFYIVLFLCLMAIGISGYILLFSNDPAEEAADGAGVGLEAGVTLPENQAGVEIPMIDDNAEEVMGEAEVIILPEPEEETVKPEPSPSAIPEEPAAIPETVTVSYVWPVYGEVGKAFSRDALVYSQTLGDWRTHSGIDIVAELNSPVCAAADGLVSDIYSDTLMGTTVVIDHADGTRSVYSNLGEELGVEVGYAVQAGDNIGFVGESSLAEHGDGGHLHFELLRDNEQIDPLSLLPER